MAVELPEPLQWVLLLLAGTRWPEADEDGLRGMAEHWRSTASVLKDVGEGADAGIRRALEGQQGVAATRLTEYWAKFTVGKGEEEPGAFPGLVTACEGMGEMLEAMANSAETAKIQIIAQLGILAFEIATAEFEAPFTAGLSLAEIPVFVGISRTVVQQILKKLVVEALEFAAKQAVQMAAINLLAQSIQVAEGHRSGIDLKEVGQSAAAGAVAGAAGNLLGKGLGSAGSKIGLGRAMGTVPGRMVTGAAVGVGADVAAQVVTTGEVDSHSLLGSGLSGAAGAGLHAGGAALGAHFRAPAEAPHGGVPMGGGPAAEPGAGTHVPAGDGSRGPVPEEGSRGGVPEDGSRGPVPSGGAPRDGVPAGDPVTTARSVPADAPSTATNAAPGGSGQEGASGGSHRPATAADGAAAQAGPGPAGAGAATGAAHLTAPEGGAQAPAHAFAAPAGGAAFGHPDAVSGPGGTAPGHGGTVPGHGEAAPGSGAHGSVAPGDGRPSPHAAGEGAAPAYPGDARVSGDALTGGAAGRPHPDAGPTGAVPGEAAPGSGHVAGQPPGHVPGHVPVSEAAHLPVSEAGPEAGAAGRPGGAGPVHEFVPSGQQAGGPAVHAFAPSAHDGAVAPGAPSPHEAGPVGAAHGGPEGPISHPLLPDPAGAHPTPVHPAGGEGPAGVHEPVQAAGRPGHAAEVPALHLPSGEGPVAAGRPGEPGQPGRLSEGGAGRAPEVPQLRLPSAESPVTGRPAESGPMAGHPGAELPQGPRLAAGPAVAEAGAPVAPAPEGHPVAQSSASAGAALPGLPGAAAGFAGGHAGPVPAHAAGSAHAAGPVATAGSSFITGPVRPEVHEGAGAAVPERLGRPGSDPGAGPSHRPVPVRPGGEFTTGRVSPAGGRAEPSTGADLPVRAERPGAARRGRTLHEHPTGPALFFPIRTAEPGRQSVFHKAFDKAGALLRTPAGVNGLKEILTRQDRPWSKYRTMPSGSGAPLAGIHLNKRTNTLRTELDPTTLNERSSALASRIRNLTEDTILRLRPDKWAGTGQERIETAGRLDHRTADYWAGQDRRREDLDAMVVADTLRAPAGLSPAVLGRVDAVLHGAPDAITGAAGVLAEHPGFVLGEKHSASDSWPFLKQNMAALREQGVDTVYLEALRGDSYQRFLDAYLAAPRTAPMPPELDTMVGLYDRTQGSRPDNGLRQMLEAAKAENVRVQVVDGYPARRGAGPWALYERAARMNTYVADAVAGDRVGREQGKFLLVVGEKHVHRHEAPPGATPEGGMRSGLPAPGLAQLLDVPGLKLVAAPEGTPGEGLSLTRLPSEQG
ncbi:hypothetical protein OG689_30025 [Kitasatospora sp. NBC_00240]|uniref:WXG100-like domain-containing protein n=1 Tax=Kitasatospora sp. NBC_00240 TaxID=2903567 RepID=UPI00225B3042|nr:hypothetical protein [Kitasatospora sp. NBC_00240]MCX5213456.1 hypothetical protein [Kitasatospora sp. NBC_00240]